MTRPTVVAIVGAAIGIALAFALVFAIFPAGPEPEARPQVIATEEVSVEQRYLDEVWPHLSPDREHDTEAVLSAGVNGVCGVWADPTASRPAAVDLLMQAEGWSLTEATAIYESAVEHLCAR